MVWLLVAFFGLAGVLTRFSIDRLAVAFQVTAPVATLSINIAGSFLAGFLITQTGEKPTLLQTTMIVGFCGGFTTFSGFSLQLVEMIQNGKMTQALALALATPLACLVFTALGMYLKISMSGLR